VPWCPGSSTCLDLSLDAQLASPNTCALHPACALDFSTSPSLFLWRLPSTTSHLRSWLVRLAARPLLRPRYAHVFRKTRLRIDESRNRRLLLLLRRPHQRPKQRKQPRKILSQPQLHSTILITTLNLPSLTKLLWSPSTIVWSARSNAPSLMEFPQ
jgi:hypothetical protein